MTDITVDEEAGRAVRKRVETVVACRRMNEYEREATIGQLKDEMWPLSLPIEILIHGNSRDDVETNLALAILGAADRRPVVWRVPPELADNTHKLGEFQRGCGMSLWSGYARFHVKQD